MSQLRADKYRKEAEECLSQAQKAGFNEDKASWLKIAARWQRMAEEAHPCGQQAQQLSVQREARRAT
jgi:hypothetical protein